MSDARLAGIVLMVILVALLSVVDLGMNIISLIPGIGDILESLSEVVLEAIQVFLVILIALAGAVEPEK